METNFAMLNAAPAWAHVVAGAVVVLAGAGVAWLTVLRIRFRDTLLRVLDQHELADELIHRRYNAATVSLRAGVIEKLARTKDPAVLRITGLDQIWIQRVRAKGRERDVRRVLELLPDQGLFACFMAALRSNTAAKLLLRWLDDNDPLLGLRRLALSSDGESFNGVVALQMLDDRLDSVREMLGDPEWSARYFAITIVLQSSDERSQRALWDAFRDSHRRVRAVVAAELQSEDRDRLYRHLYDLYLHDPVFEVRKAARQHLTAEFSERYRVDRDSLTTTEALHVIGLLEPDSTEDHALALGYLGGGDLELALPAAIYLEGTGTLCTLFREASFADPDQLARTRELLSTAASVNVTGFLDQIATTSSAASLLLAAEILKDTGAPAWISVLAEHAFAVPLAESREEDVYTTTLQAVHARGDDRAFEVLRNELMRRREEPRRAAHILQSIPSRAQGQLTNALLALLHDPEFECRDELHDAFLRFEDRSYLPALIEILHANPGDCAPSARLSAIKLLGALQLPYARQYLLENLSTLHPEEARDLARVMGELASIDLSERARAIMNGPDAATRAALIAVLPTINDRSFLKPIREAVHDADPEVRIAAIWALLEFDDTRSFNQAQDRLRDPVERVRVQAAQALGTHGSSATVEKVAALLTDENEVDEVKLAAIDGLSRSEQRRSIGALVDFLGRSDDWDSAVIRALAHKRTPKQISELVEKLKDAEPRVRDKLMRVFRSMGSDGEAAMVKLLDQDISSLRPLITEILDETGCVEEAIRRLAHRDPAVRRSAADGLSAIATLPAFRGIVMAARDPDPEVRVRVTRALEKLNTKAGKEILDQLQNDPDRKVRKYTLWALERYRAKNL